MGPANISRKVGIVIRAYREVKGLSQTDLAERAGISQPEVSLIEKGEASTLNLLDQVCLALDKKLSTVIKKAEYTPELSVLAKRIEAFIKEHRQKIQMRKKQSA